METSISLSVLLLILGVCMCLPRRNDDSMLRGLQDKHNYQFQYETQDGSKRQEVGTFEYREGKEVPVLHVKGFYSYFDKTGRQYVVHYEADDNGSKTKGDIIPAPGRNNVATVAPKISNHNYSARPRPSIPEAIPETSSAFPPLTTTVVPSSTQSFIEEQELTTTKSPDLHTDIVIVSIINPAALGSLVGGGIG